MSIEIALWMVLIVIAVLAAICTGAYVAFKVEQRRLRREKTAK